MLRHHGLEQAEPTFLGTGPRTESATGSSPSDAPGLQGFVTLHFPPGADTVGIAADLERFAQVERAVPIPRAIPPQTPLDEPLVGTSSQLVVDPVTGLDNQWYIFRCRVDQAWTRSSGNGVVVADIDWGYRTSHEDLAPRLELDRAYNSYDGGTDVSHGSSIFHGTGVMGLAGSADNDRGMAGVAFGSALWPVQANDGPGPALGGNGWARAIDWVRTTDSGGRPKVIILEVQTGSFGNYEMVPSVNAAIRAAIAAGVVVCVAAGNGDRDAGIDDQGNAIPDTGSVLVGATEYDATENRRASFSNFNARVAVCAPGDSDHDVTCSSSGDSAYRNSFGGTSGATPKVAATAALMLAVNPNLTPAQIRSILIETGSTPVTDAAKPVGRFLDAGAAVQRAAALAPGWKFHLTVDSVFAHSLSQNAQAHLSGLGWRMVAPGTAEDVTRPFELLSEAAATGKAVHVFTEANGRVSSAQLA
ncbi:S8 family serine peptidase [Cellulomonas cellasea]|uniref:Subtilisin family serine protease n=1 Tax=Cellulomonas cellasea TaxID=43670 RepID=A0A7W4Y9G8_9CELL|nr:S8 family serine peptidase [Cellulomonas cellasea]MBB2921670.1 subtilisin family serine protease [Cellulomonas cellasea]